MPVKTPGLVIYAFNPSTQGAKAGSCKIVGHPGLYTEFQDTLGHVAQPHLKTSKPKKKKNPHKSPIN